MRRTIVWLVAIAALFAGYWILRGPSGTPDVGKTATSTSQAVDPAVAWRNTTSKDPTTGALQAFAASAMVTPAGTGTPNGGIQAWVGVGCSGEREWSYIGFTKAPKLDPRERGDGYDIVDAKVWWDDSVEDTAFRHDSGSDTFLFLDHAAAIAKMAAANSLRLELDARGQNPTYFEFRLNGSFAAIAGMREQCAKK